MQTLDFEIRLTAYTATKVGHPLNFVEFFIGPGDDAESRQTTGEANTAGENKFIFIVCVKSVPLCHFRLAYVVLHMAVREFFETHF